MSKNNKIYLDTSVIGGCFDDEFFEWPNKLIEECKRGLFIPVVSELTESEISKAPVHVQKVLVDLLKTIVMYEKRQKKLWNYLESIYKIKYYL